MPSPLSVLVTGATGQQGGAVARALRKRGHHVRGLTRKPDSPAAVALRELGAEVVGGNTEDLASVERAAASVDAIFSVTDFWGGGFDAEVKQGKTIADAARSVGVKHLLYSSVPRADKFTGVPHFDSKTHVENHILSLGVPYTILGPCFFYENYLSPWFLPELQQGRLAMGLKPTTRLQQITVEDIGSFVAQVFERREEFLGKRIDIAGDEPTLTDTARILGRATSREIQYIPIPLEQLRQQFEEFAVMFEFFEDPGTGVDVAGLRSKYPEVGWHSLEQWANQQNWTAAKSAA